MSHLFGETPEDEPVRTLPSLRGLRERLDAALDERVAEGARRLAGSTVAADRVGWLDAVLVYGPVGPWMLAVVEDGEDWRVEAQSGEVLWETGRGDTVGVVGWVVDHMAVCR